MCLTMGASVSVKIFPSEDIWLVASPYVHVHVCVVRACACNHSDSDFMHMHTLTHVWRLSFMMLMIKYCNVPPHERPPF